MLLGLSAETLADFTSRGVICRWVICTSWRHVMADQLLSGIKVVECGNLVSAPYLGKLLADFGAEVIKVEEPDGDSARKQGPFPGDTPHPEKSGLFLYLNTNKLGVTLNLREPKGQALLQSLCAQADVLIHNYHPTVMASLGL